ncbi:uncharacterized protein LOC123697668 isoform X1 [Colias croceus]|uniref:uncharacterized protein LOC123697668 isoform X1 n=1 Tax=Colias crocea TaxID=72248 RepID=UPI001E27E5A0|nr:uncharacterized protein LOC123697668 isoform X1 [Colias croceus]
MTPAQAAAARKLKNERQRKNRLRQAAKVSSCSQVAIASNSLETTTTSPSRSGEESNNVQTRSERQHAQQQSTTTADQPDERVNLTNEPLFPAIPVPMEIQEAVASTSATLFAKPTTAAPKTRAQIQREYRQRIAASKTAAQRAAAREARNRRDRNNRLRQAANLVIASGSLEATTTSSSRSGQRFPRPDREERGKWIKFVQINRSEKNWLPSHYSHVCSLHFREEDIYTTKEGRRYLKKSAVPCIDMPRPFGKSSRKKIHACRRNLEERNRKSSLGISLDHDKKYGIPIIASSTSNQPTSQQQTDEETLTQVKIEVESDDAASTGSGPDEIKTEICFSDHEITAPSTSAAEPPAKRQKTQIDDLNAKIDELKEIILNNNDNDECLVFGKYIGFQLQKMTYETRTLCQLNIQKLCSEALLNQIREGTSITVDVVQNMNN